MTDDNLFLTALPVIDDVTAQVCRRHRLTAADADDFRSDVRVHFMERNCEALRRFEGRASLATYVNVVVQHLFLDWRNRLWGRWRPSVDARRLGPSGVLLERLVVRDGWSLEQALEALRINHGVMIDDALHALGVKVSTRGPTRQFVAEENASEMVGDGPPPDANVVRAEHGFLAKRVQGALERARQALAPTENLILKMRFEDRVPVADIARALHLDQRRLYRTIQRLLENIRISMTADGIGKSDVEALLADEAVSWGAGSEGAIEADSGTATSPVDREKTPWQSR